MTLGRARLDAAHRVTRLTDLRPGTSARARSFAWSPGGMLNTMQDQNGARTDYLYDPVGSGRVAAKQRGTHRRTPCGCNLIGIWGPNFDYLAFTHDAGGRLTEKWNPNGINSQYEWNPDNTLATLANRVAFDDAHVISHHAYDYDALGRRQTAVDKAGTLTLPAQNDAYAYDALDNRSRKTVNGVTQYAVFDAANQLVELRSGSPTGALTHAFVYDANGNLIRKCEGSGVTRTVTTCNGSTYSTFAWNPDDQLIQANVPGISESYQYDQAGRRIAKTSNGITTYYRYNGDDIDAEYTASWTEAARYVHGPNTDDPLMRLTGNTGDPTATAIYYHQDGIGSIVATSNQAGAIAGAQLFDAWGNKVQSSGTIAQYGFTGREPDATGMIYYRARYYDPTLGRFISRDPAGMPNGVNRYAYVGNSPTNFTDPSGEIFGYDNLLGGVFNAAVGAAVTYATGGGTWQQYARNAAVDFGVGFASSGAASVSKVATLSKMLSFTSKAPAKFISAASAEVYKGNADNKRVESVLTTAGLAGALNATGIIGKAAAYTAEKIGLTKTLDRRIPALLQPKPTAPSIAAVTEKALGAPGDFAAGIGGDYLGGRLGGESPKGNQSMQTMANPDSTSGGLFANPNSLCIVCTSNYSSGGFSNQGGKMRF